MEANSSLPLKLPERWMEEQTYAPRLIVTPGAGRLVDKRLCKILHIGCETPKPKPLNPKLRATGARLHYVFDINKYVKVRPFFRV